MKFTLINNIKKDNAMRLILTGFLSFILLYIISDVLVKSFGFGISVETINITLFGSEENFIDPITKASFLEFWHVEIFFMMMVLLTLSAVFIRLANRSRTFMTNTLMISAITSLTAIALAYFVSAIFIYLYIITFFIWHLSAVYMILYSFWKLYAKGV
ncbi:hypothetical protein SMGD1_2563 [Sulfurimonas gotlandica GD1]|uniref:Uncharacterized protein n=1 Tax=Sulfurimonas gotlandica (strain DSM 19862 / JCM 16533 / GD1) TaxID=929558 RepID=H1FS05_SULGG|nr:hypothetical protein [Sulfurimonas gotlandica]EHP31085.1 hypothetical protein SMGD1_2563 [Sulfurimonas gotlandica GD1]